MVSTRSVRYKFSEGERVLCYEPDPTKAKVLYDSKVLEVIESKDKRGKRTVEYLIHFQGWNSSWDRCVSEDFVLKDTEENRQLQRDLAEKSQLQLGAYLYRRERKKGGSNPGLGTSKRARHGFSDDGSSSSTQPDEGETAADTDTSSGSTSSAQPRSSPLPTHTCRAQIPLPPTLRDRLTLDYHLVVKRGRVAKLPATPSAADILESVVKWFGRAGAWNPPRGKHEPPQKPDILEVSARLNLVREVADGLRVYFDFIFRTHMLYKHEMAQYHEMCGQYNDFPTEINSEGEDQENQSPDDEQDDEEDEKSPRMPEYAHLPPDPDYDQDDEPLVRRVARETEENRRPRLSPESAPTPATHNSTSATQSTSGSAQNSNPKAKEGTTITTHNSTPATQNSTPATQNSTPAIQNSTPAIHNSTPAMQNSTTGATQSSTPGAISAPAPPTNSEEGEHNDHTAVPRRLRSHKSVVSQSENDDPTPSTSTAEIKIETQTSSVGSGSSSGEYRSRGPPPATTVPRTPLSLLMDKVAKFELIPREGTEHLPCRVYGAIHLARLFVILPVFLNATQMPDMKLKLILKYIDIFVQYLDEHSEWFGESFYVPNTFINSN